MAPRRSPASVLDALRNPRGEYEAALSIGLEDRDAALLVARDDAALALVPGLDQTRTVGLVTLPGAFVGMLLGGASPLQAAAVQLLVLVGCCWCSPSRCGSPSSLSPAAACASEPTGEIRGGAAHPPLAWPADRRSRPWSRSAAADELGLDPRGRTREQAVDHVRDAVHLPAPRADARRPPRQGRHRRLGHPDARGDHPRRRRRRHRLRHDRGPHPVHRRRTCPADRRAAAGVDRGGRPAVGRPRTTPAITRDHTRDADRRAGGQAPRAPASTRRRYAGNWQLQLGTLGSGNHFIEVSLDEEDRVWLFLHSGSRGVGNKIAQHHIKVAQQLCAAVVDQPARPRPRLPRRGHGRVLRRTSASCGGRSSSRCSTARR